jgi:sporulation integral membrane protein YtvI
VETTTSGDERKLKFIINCVYFALIVAIGYVTVKYFLGWVMPILIGFVLAAIVQPAARFCHKRNGANIKACSIAGVLLLVATLSVLTVLVTSRLACELYVFTKQFPAVTDSLTQTLNQLSLRLKPFFNSVQSFTRIKIDTSLSGISSLLLKFSQFPQGAAAFLHSTVSSLPSFLLSIIVAVVAACFIAADYPRVTGFLLRCLPKRHRDTACDIKNFFFTTVAQLIRAYLTLMFITFCELFVGLAFLRIKNPVTLAAIIAVVDILPVLGTGTVMIPWALIEFAVGNVSLGAGLALVYAIITVVRNILEPKIVGHRIGLHPLITLTAMVVGLKSLGIVGMITFPIGAIILKHLHESGIIKLWRD